MTINDRFYLAFLSHFIKFGQKRLKLLKNHFPNWKSAFQSSARELEKAKINGNLVSEFIEFRKSVDMYHIIEQLKKENITLIEFETEGYPQHLSEIYDPPVLLYARGNIDLLNIRSISVVGSRKYSPYGQKATYNICRELASSGLCIVSGLAIGIDSIAHQSALDAKGKTIAVLGTGINNSSIYPSINRKLAQDILNHEGLIISEFPLGTTPNKFNFPLRNRIVAGLSEGTLVVEAALKSGALITARSALDNNREVFAVPGNIYSEVSMGPNELIKQGATPVTCADDIFRALDIDEYSTYIKNIKIEGDTETEKKIISVLQAEPIHIDDIARASSLSTKEVSSTLIMMEVKGYVKNYGANKYSSR